LLKTTSLIPSTAEPGSQMLTNEFDRLISFSTIKGLPDKKEKL